MTKMPAIHDDAHSGRPREIVDAAILLFNRDGVARTSTNKIAEALGISSGNLHYHFRSKNDLLTACYGIIERGLVEALTFSDNKTTEENAFAMQMRLFSTLWKYRFFFGSMDSVLTQSVELYEHYAGFQKWLLGRIAGMAMEAVKRGHLCPIQFPNTPDLLAANSWMLWTGWIRWEMIACKSLGKDPDQEAMGVILRIIRRHLSFQEPYYSRDFAQGISALIDQEALTHGIDPKQIG